MTYTLTTPKKIVDPATTVEIEGVKINIRARNAQVRLAWKDSNGATVYRTAPTVALAETTLDPNSGDWILDEQGNPVLDTEGNPIKDRSTQTMITTRHITSQEHRGLINMLMRLLSEQGHLDAGTATDPDPI